MIEHTEHTKIQWCDRTFNPWEGCEKVSPGCKNCYAEARNRRFGGGEAVNWGPGAPRQRMSTRYWEQPLAWDKASYDERVGDRPRIFCASLSDWLDPAVPTRWRVDLLNVIRRTPNLDWLLLTKRPQHFQGLMRAAFRLASELSRENDTVLAPQMDRTTGWIEEWVNSHRLPNGGTGAPANVWVGTSVEDQARTEERIPALLSIPARVRFLSCEPLLERVHLDFGAPRFRTADSYHSEIHWVICGGESGKGARPFDPEWARDMRVECALSRVPFFMKQMGSAPVALDLIDKKGGDPGEWPEDLRVREFPNEQPTVKS